MKWNESRVNIASAFVMGATVLAAIPLSLSLSPSTPDDTLSPPPHALIDNQDGTFIVYPDVLPACDEEDGTATSDSLPVAACKWNDGTGHTFIVIAP